MQFSIQNWGWGILSFGICYLLHLCFWNRKRISKHVLTLTVVFLLPAILGASILVFFYELEIRQLWAPLFTHLLLFLNYLAIYPAFQASSPTIQILTFLWKRNNWVGHHELVTNLSKEKVIEDRVEDLKSGGLINFDGNRYLLTKRGSHLAKLFLVYRRALGLNRGAG